MIGRPGQQHHSGRPVVVGRTQERQARALTVARLLLPMRERGGAVAGGAPCLIPAVGLSLPDPLGDRQALPQAPRSAVGGRSRDP